MSRIVAVLGLLALVPVQDQRPSFRTGVELVQLDVAVLDDHRAPVRGLTEADFTVLESGRQRPIQAFSAVELPGRTTTPEPKPATGRVPPDVATNAVGDEDGRLVVILMDRSINAGQGVVSARKIATAAVDGLGPGDLAALVSTSGGVPQNLTADRSRLLAAINQRDWSTDGFDPYLNPPFTLESPRQDGRCLCGVCVLDTITRVSESVRSTPRRRKLLLFIGTGAVLQVGRLPAAGDVGCASALRDARERMLGSLALSNLTIHAIDTKGLVPIGPQTNTQIHGAQGGPETQGRTERLAMQQKDTNDLLDLHGTLRVLAERTGGRAVMDTNAPETKVPEIFRESEAYYLVAFERDPALPVDATRTIDVKVNRRGLHVHAQSRHAPPVARTSAAQPPPDPGASLTAALGGLLPAAAEPLALAASPWASADGDTATVRIVVDTGSFARAEASVPLDVRLAAVAAGGRVAGEAQQTSTLPAVSGTSDRRPIMNVPSHLELPPGDYELRVAVADPSRGRIASVFQQVSVPAFAQEPLSLSGVVLELPAGQRDGAISPTTQRTFSRADPLGVAFEVYQGTRRPDPLVPVSVQVSITDPGGGAVRQEPLTLNAEAFNDRRAVVRLSLPIAEVPPGEYVLRIVARAGTSSAERALPFRVE